MDEKDIIFNGPTDPHGYGQEVPPVTRIGPFTIGFVEEIHGEKGRPVPEYIPTKHELAVLARHWATQVIDIERWWAESEQVGSDEIRQRWYALDRLDRIADLIGEDAVNAEYDAAEAEIIKRSSPPSDDRSPTSKDDG